MQVTESTIAAIAAAAVTEERAFRAWTEAGKVLDKEKADTYAAHLAHIKAVAVRDDAERRVNKAWNTYSHAYQAKKALTKKLLSPPVAAPAPTPKLAVV